jgi:hypothetical protein
LMTLASISTIAAMLGLLLSRYKDHCRQRQ